MQCEYKYKISLKLFELIIPFSEHPAIAPVSHHKRRRVVPEDQRRHTVMRTCRRCHQKSCPGNSNILNCSTPCTVPCKICKQLTGCRGVDGGRTCTYQSNT